MESWSWRSEDDVGGVPYWGRIGTYHGGGFISALDISQAISQQTISALKSNRWLDRLTRVIFLEFTIYNPNTDLFGTATMVAERTQDGGIIQSSSVQVFRAYGMGVSTVYIYLCNFIFLIYFIGYIVVEIRTLKRLKCRAYLRNIKSYLNLIVIIIGTGMIVFFIYRSVELNRTMDKLRDDIRQYVPFRKVATLDDALKYCVAFINTVAIFKMIILLRLHRRMSDLLSTIKATASPLFSFFSVMVLLLVAYTSCAHLYFGLYLEDYSTFIDSSQALVNVAMGAFDVDAMMAVNQYFTPVFFISYMVSNTLVSWTKRIHV